MSAGELRRAAQTLRERAEAASTGPWEAFVLGSEGYAVVADRPEADRRRSRVRVARFGWEDWDTDKANAHWVATMHPGVGLVLADWLLHAAEDWRLGASCSGHALAIARLINGGAS